MAKKVYYAHCMAIYDTTMEKLDLKTLKEMGFNIVNPNSSEYKNKIKEIKANNGNSSDIMGYFLKIVKGCDGLVFRALPEDNSISAGVYEEIMTMMDKGGFIIELPHMHEKRKILSVEETRAYLQSKKG
jgi:hypothetical protein